MTTSLLGSRSLTTSFENSSILRTSEFSLPSVSNRSGNTNLYPAFRSSFPSRLAQQAFYRSLSQQHQQTRRFGHNQSSLNSTMLTLERSATTIAIAPKQNSSPPNASPRRFNRQDSSGSATNRPRPLGMPRREIFEINSPTNSVSSTSSAGNEQTTQGTRPNWTTPRLLVLVPGGPTVSPVVAPGDQQHFARFAFRRSKTETDLPLRINKTPITIDSSPIPSTEFTLSPRAPNSTPTMLATKRAMLVERSAGGGRTTTASGRSFKGSNAKLDTEDHVDREESPKIIALLQMTTANIPPPALTFSGDLRPKLSTALLAFGENESASSRSSSRSSATATPESPNRKMMTLRINAMSGAVLHTVSKSKVNYQNSQDGATLASLSAIKRMLNTPRSELTSNNNDNGEKSSKGKSSPLMADSTTPPPINEDPWNSSSPTVNKQAEDFSDSIPTAMSPLPDDDLPILPGGGDTTDMATRTPSPTLIKRSSIISSALSRQATATPARGEAMSSLETNPPSRLDKPAKSVRFKPGFIEDIRYTVPGSVAISTAPSVNEHRAGEEVFVN